MDFIQEVCDWNKERDNTEYSQLLEVEMLDEELGELIDAITDVDRADALADIIFVAVGSLYKLTGDEQKVKDILLVVSAANNLKGKNKSEAGKVTKPEGFSGPEGMIEEILRCQ